MRQTRAVFGVVVVLGLVAGVARADLPGTGPVKWSQPPVFTPDGNYIYGWDQVSMAPWGPIVADDFQCRDPRPVTDVHWWGSYPDVPSGVQPKHPDAFVIRFWKDVPANTTPEMPWSHPAEPPIHVIECRNYEVEMWGLEVDPIEYDRGLVVITDMCYQYTQILDPKEYFHQTEGEIYWISIQALYDQTTDTRWGWKTRPHYFNDDAVTGWPPIDGGGIFWEEVKDQVGRSWDVAYELTVPEPATLALLGAGAVGLALRRRRTR